MRDLLGGGKYLVARWPSAAHLDATSQKRGRPLPANDLAIAATALEMGWGVLVGPQRERHFGSIPELRVVALG